MTTIEQIRAWSTYPDRLCFIVRRANKAILLLPDDIDSRTDTQLQAFIEEKFNTTREKTPC